MEAMARTQRSVFKLLVTVALALVRVEESLTKANTLWSNFKQLIVFKEVD